MSWLRRLLCRHRTMTVGRYHAKCVRPDMRGKELYVDKHNVHCFVQCFDCRKIWQGRLHEAIYPRREE